MAGILSGCAAKEQNLRIQDRYKNLYEPADKKTLPEMTSDEFEKSGDVLLSRGNLYKAFVQYDKCLQLNPDNIEVIYKKGLLFVIGGLNQDAIKEFQKVIKDSGTAPTTLKRSLIHGCFPQTWNRLNTKPIAKANGCTGTTLSHIMDQT